MIAGDCLVGLEEGKKKAEIKAEGSGGWGDSEVGVAQSERFVLSLKEA